MRSALKASASTDGAVASTSGTNGTGAASPYRHKEPWTATLVDGTWFFTVQLACAGGSAAVAKTALAPLERVKLLLQVQHMGGALPAHHHHQQHQRQYSGLLDALRRIPQREGGLRALYRGNGANVLRLLPDVGVRFLVHDQFKVMFAPGDGTPAGHAERVAAGAATGTLKTLLLHPLDTARVRIATDQSPAGEARAYSTVRGCLADTLRTDGLRGWYRGLVPALFSTAPHLAVLFGTYDYLKALLPSGRGAQESALFPFLKVGCGCVAAVSAQLVTYPLDTVRRCLQVSGARGMTAVSYRSARDCARRLLRQHGLAGFYRGCSVACLRAAPGAALQFVAYDAIKVVLAVVDPRTGISSPLM